MQNEQSSSLETLNSMLVALAKSRSQNKGWKDAEEEVAASQVFKLGEALRPFYLAAVQNTDPPIEIPLEKETLARDTKAFFSGVVKHGFFPSPYSPVDSKDQYVDFAAFTLEFADLVLRYPGLSGSLAKHIKKLATDCLHKALEFLVAPGNYLEDDEGVRWAGTPTHSPTLRKGKVTQHFTDTYFTSNAVIALNRACDMKTVALAEEKKTSLAALISKAGRWIAARQKQGLIAGDEAREKQQLFYTTWGIRALAETYHRQEPQVRAVLKAVSATYLQNLEDTIKQKGIKITQDYIYVFSTEFETPLAYDERASWAGVLLALAGLARIQEFEATLDAAGFTKTLNAVFSGLMALRDPITDLWYREQFIVSIHSPLAEALISLSGLPFRLGYAYEVTSAIVDRAVQEAVADSLYLKTIQQLFFAKLSQLASRRGQEERMLRGLNQVQVPQLDSKVKKKPARGK